jgi:serine/threonine protein kinase
MAEGNDKVGAGIVPLLQEELPRHVLAGYMRYRKIQTLGCGGKAEVFLCRDQTLGREVAVKVLHPDLLQSAEEQHMLVREARIMAMLVHPRIPEIHDLGRDFEGRPYFAMSYVPGTTFRELIGLTRDAHDVAAVQYHLQQCLSVLIGVGVILETAHAMQVVHCDLKPENILIDNGGGVYLIDWGLATILPIIDQRAAEADSFVSERGMQGSPLYMSPEQAGQKSEISAATDVYALGVMLYECLAGRVPFHGCDVDEVLAGVAAVKAVPPRLRAPDRYVPEQLERVCLRALNKDPAERQASVQELISELRDCHLELLIDYDREVFSPTAAFASTEWSVCEQEILAYV